MKHYIIAKFVEDFDWKAEVPEITTLFNELLGTPGIHGVEVKPCCINRPNRYDLMIEIDMDQDALSAYDASNPHKVWKETYGDTMQKNTIFDSEA